MLIADKKGVMHPFVVSIPNVAERSVINKPDGTSVNKFTSGEIEALRKFRANIIEQEQIRIAAAEEGKPMRLVPSEGIFRGRSKNKPKARR